MRERERERGEEGVNGDIMVGRRRGRCRGRKRERERGRRCSVSERERCDEN